MPQPSAWSLTTLSSSSSVSIARRTIALPSPALREMAVPRRLHLTPIVVFLPLISITGVTGLFFRARHHHDCRAPRCSLPPRHDLTLPSANILRDNAKTLPAKNHLQRQPRSRSLAAKKLTSGSSAALLISTRRCGNLHRPFFSLQFLAIIFSCRLLPL